MSDVYFSLQNGGRLVLDAGQTDLLIKEPLENILNLEDALRSLHRLECLMILQVASSRENLDFLSGCKELRVLRLIGMKGLNAVSSINKIRHLEELMIGDRTRFDFNQISAIPTLRKLRFFNEKSVSRPNLWVDKFANLESMEIVGGKLDDLRSLSGLRRLNSLRIHGARVNSLEGIENLGGLRSLDLYQCRVACATALENAGSLKFLCLAFVKTLSDQMELVARTNIEVLDISFMGTVPSLKPLYEIAALKKIQLFSTSVADDSLKQLPPGLEIVQA